MSYWVICIHIRTAVRWWIAVGVCANNRWNPDLQSRSEVWFSSSGDGSILKDVADGYWNWDTIHVYRGLRRSRRITILIADFLHFTIFTSMREFPRLEHTCLYDMNFYLRVTYLYHICRRSSLADTDKPATPLTLIWYIPHQVRNPEHRVVVLYSKVGWSLWTRELPWAFAPNAALALCLGSRCSFQTRLRNHSLRLCERRKLRLSDTRRRSRYTRSRPMEGLRSNCTLEFRS